MTCGRLAAALALSLIFAPSLWAQTRAEGSIRGYVKDEQGGALPGVTVTVTGAGVRIVHTAVTDAGGFYRLDNLAPGEYTMSGELSGFAKFVREQIIVRAGLNVELNVNLKIGALTETLQVSAESPLLERSTSASSVNIDGDFQRALPLSTQREALSFLYLTPGVVSNLSSGNPVFYVHGGDMGSQVIQLDGADIAAGVQSSNLYFSMSSELLADVQVKAGGSEAAAPLGQGAVINMVSQSGTDQLKGSVFLLVQPTRWSSDNNPAGTTSAFSLTQPDASLGGPILKNRAWFFGSYRHKRLNEGVSRTQDQVNTLRALAPGAESLTNITTSHQTFAKVTAALSSAHQIQAFHQQGSDKVNAVSAVDGGHFENAYLGGHSASARLSSTWSSAFSSRVGVAYSNQSNPSDLVNRDRPQQPVHRSTSLAGGILVGSGAIANLSNQNGFQLGAIDRNVPASKLTITADGTYYKRGWIGSHEFQAGTYINPIRLFQFRFRPANGGFSIEELVLRDASNPAGGTVPFHRRIFETGDFYDQTNVNSTNYAVYVQDAWRPNTRLTINAGVRIDRIERSDRIFDAVVQRTTAVGPRFGANYLLTEDGRNVVRATWGRVHDAVSAGSGRTAGSVTPGYTDFYDVDLDGTFETQLVTPGVTALTLTRQIDLEGYHQPHLDEWLVGYQRQLPGLVTVDASVIQRSFFDRIAEVDVNSIIENGVFTGYRDERFNVVTRLTSNVWNHPVYTAFQLQVAKQTARLQVLTSYVRQWRHLEGTWQPNDPASFIQPGAFANDKGIGILRAVGTNGLSGTDQTNNQQWRDHALRLAVAYRGPWGVNLAGTYLLQSGVWSGPVITRLAAADPQFGPATVRLSTGRVVANPLATTNRFEYSTRGDEQFTTAWLPQLNVSIAREFLFRGVRVQPGLEILNVANSGVSQYFIGGANQTFNPLFRQGQNIQPPRSFQVSARVAF